MFLCFFLSGSFCSVCLLQVTTLLPEAEVFCSNLRQSPALRALLDLVSVKPQQQHDQGYSVRCVWCCDLTDWCVPCTEPSSSEIRGTSQNVPEPGPSATRRDHPDYRQFSLLRLLSLHSVYDLHYYALQSIRLEVDAPTHTVSLKLILVIRSYFDITYAE